MTSMKLLLAMALAGPMTAAFAAAPTTAPAPQPVAQVAPPTALFSLKIAKGTALEHQSRVSTLLGYPATTSTMKNAANRCTFKDLMGNRNELHMDVPEGFSITVIPTVFANKELTTVVNISISKVVSTGTVQSGGCSVPTGQAANETIYDVVKLTEGGTHSFRLQSGEVVDLKLDRLQMPAAPVLPVAAK